MTKSILALAILVPFLAQAAPMAPKAGSGDVKFTATASPGALAIQGKGETPEGRLELVEAGTKFDVSGSLKMKIDTFKTGISMRDNHMKNKYLEAEKYPEALLILSKQSLSKGQASPFEGEFVFHGVKHKVSGTAELSQSAVKAKFPVHLQEHGIPAPSFAGITVADEVMVETEFQLVPAP